MRHEPLTDQLASPPVPDSHSMTFDQATARLLFLAEQNGGRVTAAQVEADERLSVDQNLTWLRLVRLQAARTSFRSTSQTTAVRGFPFSGLVIGQLHADDISSARVSEHTD